MTSPSSSLMDAKLVSRIVADVSSVHRCVLNHEPVISAEAAGFVRNETALEVASQQIQEMQHMTSTLQQHTISEIKTNATASIQNALDTATASAQKMKQLFEETQAAKDDRSLYRPEKTARNAKQDVIREAISSTQRREK
ncbi:hypothetical protein PTSG_02454 [Salpingoeca rosetta]|uniref:Biogenesis of lysosome-related organelles complex 1 subunit 5 n=1 Tax=Salpingoeca rosetta (strain ATCC 50818 / BSB-021) TaxID=946362 RepID=F2U290_SALR5|nr:uncharacterized protein PTSG_02454 [Salpingoeca rosetta]EGD81742.1 hypothetical protein PTSG_02454 [Salpingoeca rosetta]|eukprot:XP_004996946.1 hypothetical protein PTSG_02454 [Salpingoeca rosetta]